MRGLGLPAVLVMLCCGATAGAAEDGAAAGRPMRIGTRHAPPFAIKGSDGTWSGISIDLWEEIAGELGLSYEYREYGLAELLEATRAGDITAVLPGADKHIPPGDVTGMKPPVVPADGTPQQVVVLPGVPAHQYLEPVRFKLQPDRTGTTSATPSVAARSLTQFVRHFP